jgi:presenilin-like A22 family membrane protease
MLEMGILMQTLEEKWIVILILFISVIIALVENKQIKEKIDFIIILKVIFSLFIMAPALADFIMEVSSSHENNIMSYMISIAAIRLIYMNKDLYKKEL